ncbi:MAG: hypothetical protein E7586_01460 [Ruminococcaceae bacterium]|nr:hypothetical protein [Oscillospiraceae bacterium]
MRKIKDYPLDFSYIRDYPDRATKTFKKAKPYKDTFIGLAVLEGSFLCENSKEIYESLQIGEKLIVKQVDGPRHSFPPLMVYRENSEEIGKIPSAHSIFPNVLIDRGISLWCYAEAKSFESDILEIAVSINCENY